MSENLVFLDFGYNIIYWYGVFIAVSVFLANVIFSVLFIIQKKTINMSLQISLTAMPVALIFARCYYCWFGQSSFAGGLSEVINISSGGYAFYGAIIGVLLTAIAYSFSLKLSLTEILDAAAPSISAALIIARFASITCGGDIGFAINNPVMQKMPYSIWSESDGSWILWVGFFEGIFAIITFLSSTLVYIMKYCLKFNQIKPGDSCLMFMLAHGLSQTIMESMRNDSLFMVTLGFVRISQIISIVMAVAGFIIIAIRVFKKENYKVPLICSLVYVLLLSVAVYCEFEMNASVIVLHYTLMAISLMGMYGLSLYMYISLVQKVKTISNKAPISLSKNAVDSNK